MDEELNSTEETTPETEELGTEEYLEQLGLPELDGPITVEMVVQIAPEEEEEEEEEEEDTAPEAEADTSSEEEDDEASGSEELDEEDEDEDNNENEASGSEELGEEDEDEDNDEEEAPETRKITVQLNPTAAPVTAGNFADLVEQNFYDALAFHRFVDGFVIQGGDPQSRDPEFLISDLGTGSYIVPETGESREIPLEIQVAETGEIIYNEEVAEPVELSHETGVIAMARSNALDSASSQFYFTLDDVSNQLDGSYAVFGEVADGFDVVQEIGEGDRILLARIVEGSVSSRVSEVVRDSDLLNEYANKDNQQKVAYVLSMSEDENTNDDEIEPLLEANQLEDELVPPLEEVPENNEEETEENSDSEEDEEETTSSIEELEEVEGSESDDFLNMSESDAVAMMGLEGDDEIYGSQANDVISGNQGNDTLYGLGGNDWLRGGKGDDILTGGRGDDYLIGDHGIDTLIGGNGADIFMLRGDTFEAVQSIEAADIIDDFSLEQSDEIVVIGEFVASSDFSYELVDGDTVIRLLETDDILGVVNNTPIDIVEDNLFVVAAEDYALRLG